MINQLESVDSLCLTRYQLCPCHFLFRHARVGMLIEPFLLFPLFLLDFLRLFSRILALRAFHLRTVLLSGIPVWHVDSRCFQELAE